MDTVLNKLVKDKIADILEELFEGAERTGDSVGHRRILSWKSMALVKKDSIIKSSKEAGISLSPDGTEDVKFYVRGLPDITVGRYVGF